MPFINPILIAILSGLHAGSYGAYKDSPYESFKKMRFIREMVVALAVGLLITLSSIGASEKFFVLFMGIFASSRIITEFYKLFIRVEDQSEYQIPTELHFFKRLIKSRFHRLLFGLFCAGIVLAIYFFALILPVGLHLKGALVGFLIGLAVASGGSYKDGPFEGFDVLKYARSPILGAAGGFLISYHTSQVAFMLLGAIAFERMLVELYKGFIKKGYMPGKFKTRKPVYTGWLHKRRVFMVSYFSTWVAFVILLFA